MPDRFEGAGSVLYTTVPGNTAPDTVLVTDPSGAASSQIPTAMGDRRFSCPAGALARHGVWTAEWKNGATVLVRQAFTVGPRSSGLTKWDLRLAVASREGGCQESYVTDSRPGVIVDGDLVAAPGSYRGAWVVVHPEVGEELAGVARVVKDFSGSALVLSRPFPAVLPSGCRYAMFTTDPREIDRGLRVAVRELAQRARIGVIIKDLALTEDAETGELTVTAPVGLTHTHTVYDAAGLELREAQWAMRPGRRVVIQAGVVKVDDLVSLAGIRKLYFPQFDDSVVEIEPTSLVARAALELKAARAGGAGVDVKEHLRQQVLLQQEYEANLRHASGRPPAGIRPVID